MPRICPECKTENAYGIWNCRKCGADLRNVIVGSSSTNSPVERIDNFENKLSGSLISSTPQEPFTNLSENKLINENKVLTKSYKSFSDIFEPLVDWDEEIVVMYYLREASNCLYFFLFRLWAPLMTRSYYVALTDKRMILLRFPRSGLINYKKHFSVDYREVSIDLLDYSDVIGIQLLNPPKTLSLKFPVFTKQKVKDEFMSKLREYMQIHKT